MKAVNRLDNAFDRLASAVSKSPGKSKLLVLTVAFLITTPLGALLSSWITPLEERLGSLGWTLFSDTTAEERITLVTIDEASISEIGPWPWPRDTMARLVTAIDNAGAQLQAHDIVYPESRPGDVQFLGALLDSHSAIIAQVPALGSQPGGVSAGVLTHALDGMECNTSGLELRSTNSFVAPAALFESIPKGHNAAIIDSDGGLRKSPALVCVGGKVYPSLTLAALMHLGSNQQWSVELKSVPGLLKPVASLGITGYPGLEIPLDRTGSMRIDYHKSPGAFRAVSAHDVLSGSFDSELFDNSLVIVGGTAFGMADIVPTPYSGAAFGVELQARLLASVLDMQVPYAPKGAPVFKAFLMALFALTLLKISDSRGKVLEYGLPCLVLLLPLAALFVHVVVLWRLNLWVGWVVPAMYGLIAGAAVLLIELVKTRWERSRVYQNLASYIPPAVAREVAFALPSSHVDAERCEATLLSADIRNFSAFGESRPPEEIAAILHYFVVRATEVVESFSGRLAESRGDSILAVWDGASTKDAEQALGAAKTLQESFSEQLIAEHDLSGLEPLALGVGIEQGPVLRGSIGPSHRRSFTLLGDTVSTTIRIQEMTSELAQPILLGATAGRRLPDSKLQSQGSFLLPGLKIPHTLFAPAPTAEVLPLVASGGRSSRKVV